MRGTRDKREVANSQEERKGSRRGSRKEEDEEAKKG